MLGYRGQQCCQQCCQQCRSRDSFSRALLSAVAFARDSMISPSIHRRDKLHGKEENPTLRFKSNGNVCLFTSNIPATLWTRKRRIFFSFFSSFLNYSYCRWRVIGRKLSGPGSFSLAFERCQAIY